MSSGLLLLSLVLNVYFALRMRRYRQRYKEMNKLAHEVAGNGTLDIPHLRLGELVPEVGNDREPSAQRVDLVVPYAGWGNYVGFGDSDWATLAKLSQMGGTIALHDLPDAPVEEMFRRNAPAGTVILDRREWPPTTPPSLVVLSLLTAPERLLSVSHEALLTAAPQAVILWYGYQPGMLSDAQVAALSTLRKTTALAHIHGTSLLGYRVDAHEGRL